MKDCASAAGIGANKRITNHSARKTLVQTLQDNNVPPTQIVQVTGHKNLQSVNNYSTLGDRQQESISSILSSTARQPGIAGRRNQISAESEGLSVSLPSALFHGNHITGGTFNVHISTTSSLASSTTISESSKRKKLHKLYGGGGGGGGGGPPPPPPPFSPPPLPFWP